MVKCFGASNWGNVLVPVENWEEARSKAPDSLRFNGRYGFARAQKQSIATTDSIKAPVRLSVSEEDCPVGGYKRTESFAVCDVKRDTVCSDVLVSVKFLPASKAL
ncbi:hypothetical protein Vafri_4209 [Volvox africanus]|uniref:Uncharacterized protein n=1 Tax=Volvox africanus TaxID=51714 RepID=A0A8J4AXU6_9CHLO|nr:hypothetical protein Vafri_4209 [Volvox africanus]